MADRSHEIGEKAGRRQRRVEGRGQIAAEGDRTVDGDASGSDMSDNIIVPGDHNTVFGSVETVRIASAVFQSRRSRARLRPRNCSGPI